MLPQVNLYHNIIINDMSSIEPISLWENKDEKHPTMEFMKEGGILLMDASSASLSSEDYGGGNEDYNDDNITIMRMSLREIDMEDSDHESSSCCYEHEEHDALNNQNCDSTDTRSIWKLQIEQRPVMQYLHRMMHNFPSFYDDDEDGSDSCESDRCSSDMEDDCNDTFHEKIDQNSTSYVSIHKPTHRCSSDMEDDCNDTFHEKIDENSTSYVSIHKPTQDHQISTGNNDQHNIVQEEVVTSERACIVPSITFPPLSDVHQQVQQSLRKLACSMRRSDATRRMVKRQRIMHQEDHDGLQGEYDPSEQCCPPSIVYTYSKSDDSDDSEIDDEDEDENESKNTIDSVIAAVTPLVENDTKKLAHGNSNVKSSLSSFSTRSYSMEQERLQIYQMIHYGLSLK